MAKKKKRVPYKPKKPPVQKKVLVDSLLDSMEDGKEYASIIDLMPKSAIINPEIIRAIKDVEDVRNRPLICYLANVVRPVPDTDIYSSDDLPFNEMINKIDPEIKDIDFLIVTPGGSGQQVSQFVNALRARFDTVDFIIPYMCMSAGTLLVLSGDNIWMDSRAYIGPIDPQVRLNDGTMVPAQSLIILLQKIREEGEEFLKKGESPPWDLIRLVDNIDGRILGDAITQSDYSIKMAKEFLQKYKFKTWTTHSNGDPVTEDDKKKRAEEIAIDLCSHEHWKSHAHGITRDVAQKELRLKINEIETVPGLERAVRRIWALLYWVFDRAVACKILVSGNFMLVRHITVKQQKAEG